MKSKTVVVSALLHLVVFGLALRISQSKAARRATSVAVVNAEKKKAAKAEEKPKPKPKPMLASARPELPKAMPASAKAAAPEPSGPAPAPVESGLTLGNDDGPGIALGGPAPKKEGAPGPSAKERAQPLKREKVLAPKSAPEEDDCTEMPSKPVPVQRPSEIEYTQEARASGVEGRLVLRITVGADGAVSAVDVISSVDAALDAAAIAAVKTWVFKPALRCGKPMTGGVFTLARRFELGD
jgi:protein TonB